MVDYGKHEAAMQLYRTEGTKRALALPNRGPIRFDTDGQLIPDIVNAYTHYGFYVFKGLLGHDELKDIEHDVADILQRVPVSKDAGLDSQGRPALGVKNKARTLTWVKPLSDPRGGTGVAHGRYPVKMIEPTPFADAPEYIPQLLLGTLQFSEACLRLYGNPKLLAAAASINGEDFTPFSEALFIKQPGLGGSVAWHQDGWTHWDLPERDEHTHGFNFMAQLYGCNAANGLWIVPGSHRGPRADIKSMVRAAGSDRLPDAVPLICSPGDVAICSRQVVHGSFANTSAVMRVTITFGFHRRSSILNVRSGGVHNPETVYDAQQIKHRSRLIAFGIDARRQRFPHEKSYIYKPLVGMEHHYRWSPKAKAGLKDYNLEDLGI